MENIALYIESIATLMEVIGVLVIFLGTVIAILKFLISFRNNIDTAYTRLRQSIGKAILLGLEILIAADIMYTIVADPTIESVCILGVIVLIRTFLSLSLQVELEGRFPWQSKSNKNKG